MTGADFDVAVVGAGIIGCSIAWHLRERGVQNVVLVDAGSPGAATTQAGAGFVGTWASGYGAASWGDDEAVLERYGIEFYRELARRAPIGLRANGNLFLARSDEAYRRWVKPIATHRLAPDGSRELSGSEVAQLCGAAIAADAIAGGVLHPSGIQVETGLAAQAISAAFSATGGRLITGTRVAALLTDGDAVRGIQGDDGEQISAATTVLAAGAWTNALLATVDRSLPLLRTVATRAICPPSTIPPTMPTVMVPDLDGMWVREHNGGLTFGNGAGYRALYRLGDTNGLEPPRFPQLLDALIDAAHLPLQQIFPGARLSISQWRQGLPVFTPDRQFIAGPVPGLAGLFAVTGCNEAGVTHGPGLGRVMADLVANGGCEWVDPQRYRLDRFDLSAPWDEAAVEQAMDARR
jgi:glycine/D-amino acid oxidase-like deaminating enzyme